MSGQTSFGTWLRERRKALDLTQDQLALRIGCSFETIRKIESGVRRPSRQVAELLAEVLAIPEEQQAEFVRFARVEYRDDAAEIGTASTSVHRPHAPPINVPAQRTSFVGRKPVVASVVAVLSRPSVRLLTLNGPPGIGKTRIAMQVANDIAGSFGGGVAFIPLASITDPALVPVAIGQVLGAKHTSQVTALEQVKGFLRSKEMLLVLDNFEQVQDAGHFVGEILDSCPGVKMLVTSRAALRVYGEHQFHVPTLEMPAQASVATAEALDRYEATSLFVQRASVAAPDYTIPDEMAPVVAAICRRLDGLPLAIELAAARVATLSPRAILERLDSRLRLLSMSSLDLPPRQRTLRGAIDWSHNLLDAEQKIFFRRMSVFSGGATLDAIEGICGSLASASEGEAYADIVDSITALIDNSLLRREEQVGVDPRFSMLPTIQEYAQEQLAASGEEVPVRRQHATYYLQMAEESETQLTSPRRAKWVRRLGAEQDNLREAISWCRSDKGDADLGLQLVGAWGWYWHFSGYGLSARSMVEETLRQAGEGRHDVLGARALFTAGMLAFREGDLHSARIYLEESQALWERLGVKTGLAHALLFLGVVLAQGQEEQGRTLLEECLRLYREEGNRWAEAYACDHLAAAEYWLGSPYRTADLYRRSLAIFKELNSPVDIAHELSALGRLALITGNYEEAGPLLENALSLQEDIGAQGEIAQLLREYGELAYCTGSYETAETHFRRSLELYEWFGDPIRTAALLRKLGHVARRRGEHERAADLYRRSIGLFSERNPDDPNVGMVWGIAAWAGLKMAQGQARDAVMLLGAVDSTLQTPRGRMVASDYVEHTATMSALQAQLSETEFAAAWSEGRAVPIGEIASSLIAGFNAHS
jgi:predicted ATPase/transcriptional regulator with XRE-family HTH domain